MAVTCSCRVAHAARRGREVYRGDRGAVLGHRRRRDPRQEQQHQEGGAEGQDRLVRGTRLPLAQTRVESDHALNIWPGQDIAVRLLVRSGRRRRVAAPVHLLIRLQWVCMQPYNRSPDFHIVLLRISDQTQKVPLPA